MTDTDTLGPPATADELTVLVLPATSADGAAIAKLLDGCGFVCRILKNVAAVCEAIPLGAGIVVIAEEALVANSTPLAECIRGQPVWSDLPVIVLSRAGRETAALAQIVPQIGNVSLIERPMRTTTLVSLIRSNLRARRRQYEVREHLTRQERAQREIREAAQRFRLLVENISDYAIFMIDLNGRVASWNSGAQHILGYSEQEILGKSAALFFVTEDQTSSVLEREMRDARSTGRATSTGWRVRKDGEHLFVEGVLTAVRDEDGRLLGFSKFMKDITERRRIEAEREQLLQSERAARGEAERAGRTKDEFLATLGHELRTPLNAILGWTQVLRRAEGVNSAFADGLTVIERNARAQAQIIEDLLDMSSIISGKVRLHVQRVDLAAIVEASINAIRPAAQAKAIRLHVVLDPFARAVSGDPDRLQQIFWNLLTNAVKFTPKEGRVTVTLERVNSHLEVTVADSGEGIDPEFLPHVFERFRQADASASRRHGGLGLGLSIVKQLVDLHGGSISAKSAGKGQGASFRVMLPVMVMSTDLQDPEPSREHPARSSSLDREPTLPRVDLKGVTVLVVDDESDARNLVRRLLQDCDATVTTAASGAEAFEHILREKPHLLISDIGMPTEDGYSLIRRIRALNNEQSKTPAIALTAYARVEDRVKAIQAGYQMHLSKPVEAIELVAMVASLAGKTGCG